MNPVTKKLNDYQWYPLALPKHLEHNMHQDSSKYLGAHARSTKSRAGPQVSASRPWASLHGRGSDLLFSPMYGFRHLGSRVFRVWGLCPKTLELQGY